MLFPSLFQALTSKSPVPTKGPPSLGREPACHRLLCSRHHDGGQSGSSRATGCSSGSGRSGHLHQEAGGQHERSRPGGQSLGRRHESRLTLPHTESRAQEPRAGPGSAEGATLTVCHEPWLMMGPLLVTRPTPW